MYGINNLFHLVIVKYVVIFHTDPCNKSYIYMDTNTDHFTTLALHVQDKNLQWVFRRREKYVLRGAKSLSLTIMMLKRGGHLSRGGMPPLAPLYILLHAHFMLPTSPTLALGTVCATTSFCKR